MLRNITTIFALILVGRPFCLANFELGFAGNKVLHNTPMIAGLLMILAAMVGVILLARILSNVKAVRALRESEERYRTLQDNVPVGLIRSNEAGDILSVNRALVEILHAPSAEELYRHNLKEIYADPALRTEVIKKLNKEGIIENLELELIRLDGTHMWALLSVRAVYDEDGRPAYYDTSLRDITAQKHAQEALEASEETFRNLFQNAQVGLFRTRIEDGKTLECNDQIARMFGYNSRDEAIDYYFTQDNYVDPDARRKMLDLLKNNGEFSNFEAEFRRTDGGTIWIRFSAKMYPDKGWIEGVGEDITQQKLAEIEMQKSEKRFKDLADLLPQTIFEMDLEGNFSYVNEFGLKLFGYAEEHLHTGLNLLQLLSPEEMERARRNIQLRVSGIEPAEYEYTLFKKDGSIIYAIIYVSVIMQGDIPTGLRGIVVDQTEKKKVQEFVNRAQRLETAGRIAGQVAHDINNLLGPLVAYPDLILEELPTDHPIIPLIVDIKSSARQLAEINQQLLTLGRRGNYNQAPMDLNNVVDQVLAQIFPMPPNLKIQKHLEPDLMNMMGGESQIMRVVSNLVSNALDAMQNIGLLTISTGNICMDDETIGKWGKIPEGRYVRLTVSDTGCGIAQDIMPNIFDPFFTTKKTDRKKGSGLGLSTVFAVVEDHNGYIDCNTKIGKGTTFHIYFPVTDEPKAEAARDEIVGGNENILVVDNDNEQGTICMTLLNKLGYDTHIAQNADMAVEFIKSHKVDLLLLDLDMEEDSFGPETYRQIQNTNPAVKVVAVSGYAESGKAKIACINGVVSVIHRPFTIKSLALGVRHALDRGNTETITAQ